MDGFFKMKIATLCPTKGRPAMLKEMISSFNKMSICDNQLFIIIDADDITPYSEKPDFIFPKATLTVQINRAYEVLKNQGFTHFHVTNDDVIYQTSGWDKLLVDAIEGSGISYGRDGSMDEGLCTFSMISADIPLALGWLQCPAVDSLFADNIWFDLGHELGRLYYEPKVFLEHRHWSVGKRTRESDYMERYKKDEHSYQQWRKLERFKQATQIRHELWTKCLKEN